MIARALFCITTCAWLAHVSAQSSSLAMSVSLEPPPPRMLPSPPPAVGYSELALRTRAMAAFDTGVVSPGAEVHWQQTLDPHVALVLDVAPAYLVVGDSIQGARGGIGASAELMAAWDQGEGASMGLGPIFGVGTAAATGGAPLVLFGMSMLYQCLHAVRVEIRMLYGISQGGVNPSGDVSGGQMIMRHLVDLRITADDVFQPLVHLEIPWSSVAVPYTRPDDLGWLRIEGGARFVLTPHAPSDWLALDVAFGGQSYTYHAQCGAVPCEQLQTVTGPSVMAALVYQYR